MILILVLGIGAARMRAVLLNFQKNLLPPL
jgi:hypothetical protein